MRMINNSFIYNTLYRTQNQMEALNKQLSTGLRINSAADDPSGLAITSKLKTQINSLKTYNKTAENLTSLLESTDDVLSRGEEYLNQMKELAIQAQDATLSATDRTNLGNQMTDLVNAYDQLMKNSKYNGVSYLNDTAQTSYTVNTGLGSITFKARDMSAGGTGGIDLTGSLTSTANASSFETKIKAALDSVASQRNEYGAKMNLLDLQKETNASQITAFDDARAKIEEVDMSKTMSEFTRLQLIQQSNIELLQSNDQFNYALYSSLFQG